MLGGAIVTAMLYFLFRGFDYARFVAVVAHAEIRYVLLIPATILIEQIARAWKWRQILASITPASTSTAFRALMAGYVPGLVVGLGTSALTRAWLVARRDPRMTTSAVVATIAIDRLIDSIAFVVFVAVALVTTTLPATAHTHALKLGLAIGATASFIATALLLFTLFHARRQITRLPKSLTQYLPRRWSERYAQLSGAFAQGIAWPRRLSRRIIIIAAATIIKLLAVAQFFWAGLALGIVLPAPDYIFIMVFLGIWVLIGFVIQIPGSAILAAVFVLGLFGIAREQALAMSLMVGGSFLFSYGGVGALALWLEGIHWRELQS